MFRIRAPVLVIPTADAKWLLALISRPPGSPHTARSRWRRRIGDLVSPIHPPPAAVDVKRSPLIAKVNAAVGGKPIVRVSAEVWPRRVALDQPLRKRLISSKKRSEAGSCSRNK